jgi:hypothetical protein
LTQTAFPCIIRPRPLYIDLDTPHSTLLYCILLIILCFTSHFISFAPISLNLLLPASDYIYEPPHSLTYPYTITIEPDITPFTPFSHHTFATGTDLPGLATFGSFKFPAASFILVLVWLFPDHTASLDISAQSWQTTVDIICIHICISYPLEYLKYLNKYPLTTNVSTYVKYVNTFACQNYLRKIVVLHISESAARNGYVEHNYLT